MVTLSTHGAPPSVISPRDHSKLGHSPLRLERTDQATKFKCNGCHEHGTGLTGGNRYTCEGCDFDLHEACNLAEGTTLVHPLLPRSTFELRFEAPRSKDQRRLCDACGNPVQGLRYHCGSTDLDLHPCCAKLPPVIQDEEGKHTLELRGKSSHRCMICKDGGGVMDFWFYRSACKTVYLHVRCVKGLFLLPSSSTASSSDVDVNGRLVRYVKDTALQTKDGSGKAWNFDTMLNIVKAVVSIILAVITGNPVPLWVAGFDL